jgi:NAD(P)-dependent dehydrogenase (short-subunit alcohol dehydrogenase family)
VVVADIDRPAAESTAEELRSIGVRAVAQQCDVSDRTSVEQLADVSWREFGHVDLIVNNAGVLPPVGPLLGSSEADMHWVFGVNAFGVINGCIVFGNRFVDQGTPAHIVNTGSEHSLAMSHAYAGLYTGTKHAILGMSDVLRRELPAFVGVSVLCPGVVRTDLINSGRHRPDEFGGPLPPLEVENPMAGPWGLSADEIGNRTLEGVRRGDFYIVTHPPVRAFVDERYAELAAAFDAQAPRFEGDEFLDTRAQLSAMEASTD